MMPPKGTFCGHDILAKQINARVHANGLREVVSPCGDLCYGFCVRHMQHVIPGRRKDNTVNSILLETFKFLGPNPVG